MQRQERQQALQQITKRLIVFTGLILAVATVGLYLLHHFRLNNSFLPVMVFAAGLVGGFVSIQQRLPRIELDELRTLSQSWFSITLIPINGGIFALVLMLMFAGQVIQGQLFPTYPDGMLIFDADMFRYWISHAYPETGTDVAKLFFWSFVAGFSERFVPQIIRGKAEEATTPPKPAGANIQPPLIPPGDSGTP